MSFSHQLNYQGPIKGSFLLKIELKTLIFPNFDAPKTPIFVCRFQFPFGFKFGFQNPFEKTWSRRSVKKIIFPPPVFKYHFLKFFANENSEVCCIFHYDHIF